MGPPVLTGEMGGRSPGNLRWQTGHWRTSRTTGTLADVQRLSILKTAIAALVAVAFIAGAAPRTVAETPVPRGEAALATYADSLPPAPETISLLGDSLVAPALPDSTRQRYEKQLAAAQNDFDHHPHEASTAIWLGRRLAYLGRFREAIAVYSTAIEDHPDEPRLLRHRGHRYLTLRMFPLAISDLERASRLMAKRMDETEPDGLPNARNIPTTTLKFNIWYHLGLARFLSGDLEGARLAYRACRKVSTNPDMRCATAYWSYITLICLRREGEARGVLKPIRGDMDVIENRSYQRLCLMFRGDLPPDSVLTPGSAPIDDATIGYGVGVWNILHSRSSEAERVYRRVVAGTPWPAFGHIAAEAELRRFRDAREH